MALWHLYVPEYDLQGQSFETDEPESVLNDAVAAYLEWLKSGKRKPKDKLVRKGQALTETTLFSWLRGDQSKMKYLMGRGDIDAIPISGAGHVSREASVLRFKVRAKYGLEPKEGLTVRELEGIESGKRWGARWFK